MFKSLFPSFETIGIELGRLGLLIVAFMATFFGFQFLLIGSPALAAVVAPIFYIGLFALALAALLVRALGTNALRAIRRARYDAEEHQAKAQYYWKALTGNPVFQIALGDLDPRRLNSKQLERILDGYHAICAHQVLGFKCQYDLEISAKRFQSQTSHENFYLMLAALHKIGALGNIALPEARLVAAQGFIGIINGPKAIAELETLKVLMRFIALGFVMPMPLNTDGAATVTKA